MNVLTLGSILWKYKRVTIPVIVLTIIAMFYVVALKPPVYQAKADILLGNPPAAPTAAQIAANPKLGKVNSNNQFVGLGNLVLVADIVIEVVSSPATQQQLVAQGVTTSYSAALDVSFESPPAVVITGQGSSPAVAEENAQIVTKAAEGDLYDMQKKQGINPTYMITSTEYVKPTSATSSSSGALRKLIEVLVLGLFVLLVAVSIAQGLAERKNRKRNQEDRVMPQTSPETEPAGESTGARYYDSASSQQLPFNGDQRWSDRYQQNPERPDTMPQKGPGAWSGNRADR
jgi:capsular polysaccharide biosynthesis protein